MQPPRLFHALTRRGLTCLFLATSTAVGPSLEVWAQQQPSATPPGAKAVAARQPIDTTYVSPGAFAIAVIRPAQLMNSPMGQFLPIEVATAAGVKYLGIDPVNVEEASIFVEFNPMMPIYGLSLKFAQPLSGLKLPQELRAHTKPDQLAGKKYLKSQNPMLPSFYAVDNRTLLVAPDATLRQLIETPAGAKSGPLIDRIRKVQGGNDFYVAVDLAPVRPFIQMGMAPARKELPAEAQKYLEIPDLLSAAELTFNFSKPAPSSLVVHANDETAAQRVESLIADAEQKFREQMKTQMMAEVAKHAQSNDPVERAWGQYVERVSNKSAMPFMPKRDGADFTFFRIEATNSPQSQLTNIAVIGILVALLLPAIQAAREAARRNSTINNMKQIELALQIYQDARRTFPAHAIYSKDGKPLLSWRVAILPFMDQQQLYSQFHLDEPWDSENNRPLIARMPDVFRNPSLNLPPGKTTMLAPVGKECIFDGSPNGMKIQDITDGTSHTIMLVEADANKAVEWTKPDDWQFDVNNPTDGLGHVHPGIWLAGFADAHIEALENSTDAGTVRALMTRAGRDNPGPGR